MISVNLSSRLWKTIFIHQALKIHKTNLFFSLLRRIFLLKKAEYLEIHGSPSKIFLLAFYCFSHQLLNYSNQSAFDSIYKQLQDTDKLMNTDSQLIAFSIFTLVTTFDISDIFVNYGLRMAGWRSRVEGFIFITQHEEQWEPTGTKGNQREPGGSSRNQRERKFHGVA